MKVKNMRGRTGREVANQFLVYSDDGVYFQSYSSIIAFEPLQYGLDSSKIQLDKKYWDYSVTTSRYRNQFLGETKKETQRKIDSGEYELVDLNPAE